MIIFKKFSFDSAHFLPNVAESHKCRQVHGHTYQLTIYLKGPIDPVTGWVVDFADIKREAGSVVSLLDHKLLNNIPGLENPTCELVCVWLWNQLKPKLPALNRVELYETLTSGAVYVGE